MSSSPFQPAGSFPAAPSQPAGSFPAGPPQPGPGAPLTTSGRPPMLDMPAGPPKPKGFRLRGWTIAGIVVVSALLGRAGAGSPAPATTAPPATQTVSVTTTATATATERSTATVTASAASAATVTVTATETAAAAQAPVAFVSQAPAAADVVANDPAPVVTQPAPTYARPVAAPVTQAPPAAQTQAVTGAFKNCREAWAAGAAPVRRGQPGYGPHLDRDNDGIGCEVRPA